jgi:DNA-directed RNA polymerase
VALQPVLDSLNVLSACPWRINAPVLDILIDVFNKGTGRDLDVPRPAETLPMPPKIPSKKSVVLSKDEWLKAHVEIEAARKAQSEMHSLWCTELYRLSVANMYRDKIVWFPHSLDFRGRCYTIPPHFHHLGLFFTIRLNQPQLTFILYPEFHRIKVVISLEV